ncbi:MAG TPA: hypothetical protein VFZ53_34655 [Polyangiaceae bacterium]
MSTRRLLAALALLLAWSCGDEGDDSAPPTSTPDAGESSGGSAGASGSTGTGGANGGEPAGGTSGSSGAGAQGGSAGTGGEGGELSGGEGGTSTGGTSTGGTGGSAGFPTCASDSESDEPPNITAECDPAGTWGAPVDLPLMDGAAELVAITPDELSIAWYGNANMDTKFYVADRASQAVNFGAGTELAYRDYFTLSPDGLRLVALGDDGMLVELVRTAREQAFGAPSEGSFATLDAAARANGETFLGAVIAPDDATLYYLVNNPDSDYPLHVSRRTGPEPWPVGSAVEICEFKQENGVVRQPTGVSTDGRTLFFNDFVRGVSRAAWRDSATGPFVWFADLGTRGHPQPNADCSRLYFHVTSGPAYADAE